MGAAILNRLTLGYWTEHKTGMMYQLEIWCRCCKDIDIQLYLVEISNICFKFELRLKVTWLVDSLLPWQPNQNIGDMIMCVILPSTFVPSLTSMGCLTFKLEMFQYLANQRHCCYHGNKCVTESIF